MASKITPEQQIDLQTHVGVPVPVQDEAGKIVCYMISAIDFDDENSMYNQKLKTLLEEGDNSPRIDSETAFARMRQSVQNIADKSV